jgi:hypothetical protein
MEDFCPDTGLDVALFALVTVHDPIATIASVRSKTGRDTGRRPCLAEVAHGVTRVMKDQRGERNAIFSHYSTIRFATFDQLSEFVI